MLLGKLTGQLYLPHLVEMAGGTPVSCRPARRINERELCARARTGMHIVMRARHLQLLAHGRWVVAATNSARVCVPQVTSFSEITDEKFTRAVPAVVVCEGSLHRGVAAGARVRARLTRRCASASRAQGPR